MSARSELIAAREAMAKVLDQKLPNMPEWQAFRAIDRAISAIPGERIRISGRAKTTVTKSESYGDNALAVITAAGHPLTTKEVTEAVRKRRDMNGDFEKARANVQSAMSRDARIESIPWHGGRAWWLAGRPLPEPPEGDSR